MLILERPFPQSLLVDVCAGGCLRPVQHPSHCVCRAAAHVCPEEVVKGGTVCPTARVGPAGARSPGEPGC